MVKRLMVLLTVLAFAAAAAAAEGQGGGEAPKPRPRRDWKRRTPRGIVKSCPVLSRLAFTDEQKKKVKAIEAEFKTKVKELFKDVGEDRRKRIEAYRKIRALREEYRKKVIELLTDEQKKKLAAGMVVLAAYGKKVKGARDEFMKARKEAGDEEDKRREAGKAYREKMKALRAEMEKQLDEKVGPRVGKPAKRPDKKPDKKPSKEPDEDVF